MQSSVLPSPARRAARRAARLFIDLAAARDNFRRLARWVAPAAAAAVIKADAYGLGVEQLAPEFARAGARDFFVASPGEGAEARQILEAAGFPTVRILVLHGLETRSPADLIAHRLVPVLNDAAELALWLTSGEYAFALHVDTGMNRLGLDAAAIGHALELCRNARRIPELLITHFASADEPDAPGNTRQLARFADIRTRFPGIPVSLANSAAALRLPQSHGDLVRLGIGLYGGAALDGVSGAPALRNVATLRAPVIARRRLEPGAQVGYGGTFTATTPMEVATVALGYSDGFLRAGAPTGYAALRGRRMPILGRISMDLTVVDVTACPAEACLGSMPEFLGPEVPLADVASAAGTIAYECLTSLGARCFRVWSPSGDGET